MKFHLLYSQTGDKLQIVETGETLSGDGWKEYSAIFSADKISKIELMAYFIHGLIIGSNHKPTVEALKHHIEKVIQEQFLQYHIDNSTAWDMIIQNFEEE